MKKRSTLRLLAGGTAVLVSLGQSAFLAHAAPHAKIGASRATAIVLKRFPGHLTAKTTLENEEGKWQYGVMVRSGKTLREVMVNAYTGKIASVEVTTAAKEVVEKQQDAAAARSHKARRDEKGEKESGAKESDERGEDKG